MKKIAVFLSLVTLTYVTYFIISCTPEIPVGGCDGSFSISYVATADTVGNGHPDGTITITPNNSTGVLYTINGDASSTNNQFLNLVGGQTYTIVASSPNGCAASIRVRVDTIAIQNNTTPPPPPPCGTITVSTTSVNPTSGSASDGSITASAMGASGPFTYSLNNGAFQSNGAFTGLAVGTYTVTAKSVDGCTGTKSVTLSAGGPAPCGTITVTATSVNPTTANTTGGSITASATGGTAPFTYSLNSGAFQSSGAFTGLAAGTYIVTAKSADGCTGTKSVTLTATALVSFARDIQPIIAQYCGSANISCHNHSNNWTTYSDIAQGTAGTPWPSHLKTLIGRMRSSTALQASGSHNMPPSNSTTWTTFVQGLFTQWVNQGFQNN